MKRLINKESKKKSGQRKKIKIKFTKFNKLQEQNTTSLTVMD